LQEQVQGQEQMMNFQTLQQVVVVVTILFGTILRENQIQRQDPTPVVVAFV
jgi:hypothetical protein